MKNKVQITLILLCIIFFNSVNITCAFKDSGHTKVEMILMAKLSPPIEASYWIVHRFFYDKSANLNPDHLFSILLRVSAKGIPYPLQVFESRKSFVIPRGNDRRINDWTKRKNFFDKNDIENVGIAFADPDTTRISIGTLIKLYNEKNKRSLLNGRQEKY